MEDLIMQDMENVEALNTIFASVFTNNTGFQECQVPETRGNNWSKEDVSLMAEN